ncbi:DoxX family protein [Saccharopolyspora griseoalba]|uniref:DoxX family protein n=1 Tax=Saccharopolyspora griseoalba TaxID=1431848 RepID=A0ABW2LMF4_9PSEU
MTTTTRPAAATRTRPARARALGIGLLVLQVLLAALFAFAALPKLLGDPVAVRMFHEIGFGSWFRHFTGAVELLGAVGLLVPRSCGFAAAGLACVMIGATISNLALGAPGAAVTTIALFAVLVVLARARRNTFLPVR